MDSKLMKDVLTAGLLRENPTIRLLLGMCPSLAVTTMAQNGIGMGIAATFVLIGSNVAISMVRNIVPDKVRIPVFITIIAGFVTVVQLLMAAFLPDLNRALGIYIPLIVVNCIILARAEMFACKNGPLLSLLDAVGMGAGFTIALIIIGSIREFLGSGTWMGLVLTKDLFTPAAIMILPPGGFLVMGFLIAAVNKISLVRTGRLAVAAQAGLCGGCGDAENCAGCGSGNNAAGLPSGNTAAGLPSGNKAAGLPSGNKAAGCGSDINPGKRGAK